MKILMITESNLPGDPRVRQEAQLLSENGHQVSIICIKGTNQTFYEVLDKVKIYRVPKITVFKEGKQITQTSNSSSDEKQKSLLMGVLGYGIEYIYFTVVSLFVSLWILLKDNFDVVHTHNPPDSLFVIGLFYKLFNKKYIFDHHDLSPELFIEKYNINKPLIHNILKKFEILSCKIADVIITTNESYKQIEIERAKVHPEKIFIVRNGPKLDKMKRVNSNNGFKADGAKIMCFMGAINKQDGVENLIVILARLVFKYGIKNIKLMILGDGDYEDYIKEFAKELSVEEHVIFCGYIRDIDELNRYMSAADIFVDAAFKTNYNDHSTFIKHMEYMVFGKPIFTFDLKESKFSLGDAGIYVENNDTDLYAQKVAALIKNGYNEHEIEKVAKERISRLHWGEVSKELLVAYDSEHLS